MSDMKRLIEKMDQFAGQAVGQKPGDQVRGTEKAKKSKDNKHPFAGRLVGASESKSLLADLEKELVEGAVKRSLAEEFAEFKEAPTAPAPVAESRVKYDKKTGQMAVDNTDPDQRHGLYVNGKLVKTVNGAEAANNLKKRDPRFKDATVKKIAEGLTPDSEFLTKEERVKAGDKVYYKGKCVGIATGQKAAGKILFTPNESYGTDKNVASLPSDVVSLREFTELELAIMEGGNSLEEPDDMFSSNRTDPLDKILREIWNKIENVVGQIYPDGDPIDYLGPWIKQKGYPYSMVDAACKKNGYDDIYAYWDSMGDDLGYGDDLFNESDGEQFGYKRLHPEIFKARQQFPLAKSDMEALLMYVQSQEEQDIERIDRVNDREDAEIEQLDKEENSLERRLEALTAQLEKLKTQAKTVKEEVPAPVATAGGPAGANQPKTVPGATAAPVDPAQAALLKQNQAKMQQNLANLKSAGVQIDPAKAAQTLQKTDTGAPMNAMDKDNIAAMAPAIGNVMSNPQTATQLNTLIKKAGGGV